jgi:hypothetical protein
MTTADDFNALVLAHGSTVVFHRETGGDKCPCLSPEGYRNLHWHKLNPAADMCNEQGRLNPTVVNVSGKAFVQPVQSGATRRLTGEYVTTLFDEIQVDDHVGIFPASFSGTKLDFNDWDQSGEDYIWYDDHRYMVVSLNRIPSPDTGLLHHYETGLRLIRENRNVT